MRTPSLPNFLAGVSLALFSFCACADEPAPTRELRDLNKSYFPFAPVKDAAAWTARRAEVKKRVLLGAGLWPMPEKTPLNAVIHGRVERDDYTIDKVFFESLPGHFVTGNLYLPKKHGDKIPAVLCPHGHWPNGRFMNAAAAEVKKQMEMGAEKFVNGAHSPLQARCVQLARMGCAVFHYDMIGVADSVQFKEHRHGIQEHGFLSPEAEQNLNGYFGLQIWNGERALDFLTSLPYVDKARIGCTGASGGGTQTLILTGIDDRITASFPCVMTSTAMQGGCTCENANHLRIGQGNIDIAALAAPRPLGMTAADDWTKELETKGFPDLKKLYTMLGVPDRVEGHYNIQFPHNYNHVSRQQMYAFFNKYFNLGLPADVDERDFTLSTKDEMSVWNGQHPTPSGDQTGEPHEVAVCHWFEQDAQKQIEPLLQPKSEADLKKMRGVVGAAWEMMLGGKIPGKDEATFGLGTKEDKGSYFVLRGVTNRRTNSIDGTFLYPKNWNNSTVLWLSLKGADSILTKNGDLTPPAQRLLSEGYSIACPTLYMLGATKNPDVYNNGKRKMNTYEGYAGYHYGYNLSVFAQRVQDALATVAMIRDHPKHHSDHILVAGVEGAGAIAAAATGLSGGAVDQIVTAPEGLRFKTITDVWDVNFIPGAVKYGGVRALLALCAPVKLTVVNEEESSDAFHNATAAEAAYKVNRASLRTVTVPKANEVDAVVNAFVGNK
jgi:cephalosporin-C deacetylase-like acetyl esterase